MLNHKLNHLERQTIRSALNMLWDWNVKEKFVPLKIKDDQMLNLYHQWCREQEKDNMSDFYWIQQIRKKLDKMEKIGDNYA